MSAPHPSSEARGQVLECQRTDPEVFFATRGRGYAHLEFARSICAPCPLKLRCVEWAIENDEVGIWAGTTERDRAALAGKNYRRLS